MVTVTTEDEEQDYDLTKASALTAPFELYAETAEGELLEDLEDAVTTLKILELQALFENNSDNEGTAGFHPDRLLGHPG